MDYIAILQQHNLKVTPQRLEIVDILYKNGHLNIDELYRLLKIKFPALSLATIYKNINKMCENLFLSEVKIPNQKNVYEITKDEHSHVVCSICNEVMDITLDLSTILDEAQKFSNYDLDRSSIVLNGVCPKCKK